MEGLHDLQKQQIIHRDLKPANILFDKNNNVFKISDFGFARIAQNQNFLMDSLVGTPLYMSPQILKNQKYSAKCDIWSIGLIFYQLIYGKTPWPCATIVDLVQNMFESPLQFPKLGQFGEIIDENIKLIIKGCLQFEENERFSLQDLFECFLFSDKKDNFNKNNDSIYSFDSKKKQCPSKNIQLNVASSSSKNYDILNIPTAKTVYVKLIFEYVLLELKLNRYI
ncbi:protein kinase domain protein [Ichthyophthirius multifiliis]|uniref:Protein kinase domain protein n=1 Tax=Ichthyophthirius multifiliis TaxID=5932 RepID=G0QY56_ICHMU|nr:protein kinase domain protein [Ichthyophthirius multifiliis]EGR29853.1 protein kinase domain protein [Ichthyophthirius multifiliis]|eukprot:XP_004031089.1 protein kinase domain protein [Ichthyophthirius multifiliis]